MDDGAYGAFVFPTFADDVGKVQGWEVSINGMPCDQAKSSGYSGAGGGRFSLGVPLHQGVITTV